MFSFSWLDLTLGEQATQLLTSFYCLTRSAKQKGIPSVPAQIGWFSWSDAVYKKQYFVKCSILKETSRNQIPLLNWHVTFEPPCFCITFNYLFFFSVKSRPRNWKRKHHGPARCALLNQDTPHTWNVRHIHAQEPHTALRIVNVKKIVTVVTCINCHANQPNKSPAVRKTLSSLHPFHS